MRFGRTWRTPRAPPSVCSPSRRWPWRSAPAVTTTTTDAAGDTATTAGLRRHGGAGGDWRDRRDGRHRGARRRRSRTEFEFFSWWTGGGDSEGKEALLALFAEQNPGVEIVDSAIAGGAGTNAQAELANRLLADNPPDSYQRHAGKELLADIEAGEVEDLNFLYDEEGWRERLPGGTARADHRRRQAVLGAGQHPPLEPALVQPGRPRGGRASPHRRRRGTSSSTQAETLEAAGQDPADDRSDVDPAAPARERAARRARRRGLHRAVGRHDRLGVGRGHRRARQVHEVLEHSNLDSAAADWQPAIDPIIEGDAAYNVMGDWADTYFRIEKELDVGDRLQRHDVARHRGRLQLPVRQLHAARRRAAPRRRARVAEAGRLEGGPGHVQPGEGLDPGPHRRRRARCTPATSRRRSPDWTDPSTTIVGSLAHGVVADNAWKAEIDSALQEFVGSGDSAAFAAAVKARVRGHPA